jgi:N-methylhydantoinase A
VHGTTIATNAVLSRTGSKTALLTTEGLRDSLQMRKSKKEEPYNLRYQAPSPVIPRRLRLPVHERLDWKGDVLIELDEDDLANKIDELRDEGVESIAVCYMHAYVNGDHESRTTTRLREELPGAYVIGSADTLPIVGFYDRVSTVSLAAYVGPILFDYLSALGAKLSELGFQGTLLIMKSNGGVISPGLAGKNPAVTLLSGPAASPKASLTYLEPHGLQDCITVDMGGTSFEASLVRDGEPLVVPIGEVDRLRIALPMLDVHTIGAGGGSIAWFDDADLLRMGPRSSGAVPGPACYDAGGQEATATDADLVLGYINPEYFLGGRIQLAPDLARAAIAHRVARRLGTDVESAAVGMNKVTNVNMAAAIRQVSIAKGYDPREFPLVVAGGAGPIHAAMIAEELEIARILVPRSSAVFCATGMLFSSLQHDYVRSVWRPGTTSQEHLSAQLDSMRAEAIADLQVEGVAADRIDWRYVADIRYSGQFHEVEVPIEPGEVAGGLATVVRGRFERLHDQLFGHTVPDAELEVIHVRLTAIGMIPTPAIGRREPPGLAQPATAARRAYLPSRGAFVEMPVLREPRLDEAMPGPLLIDLPATSIFVPDGWRVANDELGSYVLTKLQGG